ncbi:MAG: hypothetical protein KF727_14880 [Microbacteriaceae bacterium]|nr:hypothetical protein [Microbacteriaceae bacterium]
MSTPREHEALAVELRRATLAASAFSADEDRRLAIAGSHDGAVGVLISKLAEESFRVTDADVERARTHTGSDKGAFEIVLTASIGAGLKRWDIASRVIEEAAHEAP